MIRYRYPAAYDVPCDGISDEEMLFVRIARFASKDTKQNYLQDLRNNLRRIRQILDSDGEFTGYFPLKSDIFLIRRRGWICFPELTYMEEHFFRLRQLISDYEFMRMFKTPADLF